MKAGYAVGADEPVFLRTCGVLFGGRLCGQILVNVEVPVMGGTSLIQVWIPVALAAWVGIYLGHAVLGHNIFEGSVLDWALGLALFMALFLPIWALWGFICGLFGYGRFPMVRGFEIGWEKAIDWTGRSHKYGRLDRQERKELMRRIDRLALEHALRRGDAPTRWRTLLSAQSLDDIPEAVRIGSPYDASDDEVYEYAKLGLLHPRTNYGVVYRVAFASRMQPGEQPITMRVMFASSQPASSAIRKPTTDDMAWLLVTSRALRWHFVSDGVPDNPESSEPATSGNPRNAEYEKLRPVDVGLRREWVAEYVGPFGAATFEFFGFRHATVSGDWLHVFGLAPGFETDALMREIHERIAYARHER